GLTDYVSPESERERIRRTLYRVDASALAAIAPAYAPKWSPAELARYRGDGVAAAKQALSDLVRRRTRAGGVEFQEEPYYSSGVHEDRVDDPELRVRVIRNYCQAEPRLAAL